MANEFKVRKGLIVEGSGSAVLDIQGSQGQLFSITDDLTGDIFSVSDISGVPILNVNAGGTTTIDGAVSSSADGIRSEGDIRSATNVYGMESILSRDITVGRNLQFAATPTAGTGTKALMFISNGSPLEYRTLGSNAFNSNTYNNYSLPSATAEVRGGVKIGYEENGKNYPVELAEEQMYVNVPWTDNNTQRAIHDTPVDGATTTSISSNWAFDNVKKAVPSNAVFTDTNTNTQRTDQEIEDVIEKNVNPVVSATVSNDTTTFTKQDGSTFALTTSDANNNTVTSIRKDNSGTYRTGNINLVGGDNVTIVEKTSGEFIFSSTDTNTDTNTQRSDEEIRDVASAQWTNGTNTTVVKDDANNTIKINSVNTTYAIGNGGLTQHNFTSTLKDKLDAIPFVQENDNIDIGTETIMTVYTSPWNAVFFDYVVIKGGNMRAGTVTAVNDGTNVEFIETSTADLGDTSDVKLFCDIDTDSMRFRATVKSNDWKVKVLPRMI